MPLKVFVGGGIRELAEERALASKIIDELKLEPLMWELLSPSAQDAGEAYLDGVRLCDLYVGLVGLEGSPESLQELQEAVKADKKCIVFVKKVADRQPGAVEFMEQAREFKCTEYSNPQELSSQLWESLLSFVTEETLRLLEAKGKSKGNFVHTYLEDYVKPVLDEIRAIEDSLTKKRLAELPTNAWNAVSRSMLFGTDSDLDQRIAEFYSRVQNLNGDLRKMGIEDHRQIVISIMQESFLESARGLNEYFAIERILTENLEFFLASGDAYSELAKPLLQRLDDLVKSIPPEHWKNSFVSPLWLVNRVTQRTKLSPLMAQRGMLKGSGSVEYFEAFGALYPKARLVREVLQRIYQRKIQV